MLLRSFFVCAALAIVGPAQTQFTIRQIQPLAGQFGGDATGIDDDGRLCGTSGTVTGFAVRPGRAAVPLLDLAGGQSSRAEGIAAGGVILGASAINSSGTQHATLWRPTQSGFALEQLLPATGDIASIAEDLNNAGIAVGCTDDLFNFKPAAWVPSPNGFVINPLPLGPGDSGGVARSINSSSVIVGSTGSLTGSSRAAVWSQIGGAWQHRPLVGRGLGSTAVAINNGGEAAGTVFQSGSGWRMSGWTAGGTLVDLGQFAGRDTFVRGMNQLGNVVGDARGTPSTAVARLGGFSSNTPIIDLSTMIPPRSGWTRLLRATDINAKGEIVGTGEIAGFRQAFVLSPADLQLAVTPGTSGNKNTWTVTGAQPGALIAFLVDTTGGEIIRPSCNSTINLSLIASMGIVPTNSAGSASVSMRIPDTLSGQSFLFQALELGSCSTSGVSLVTF